MDTLRVPHSPESPRNQDTEERLAQARLRVASVCEINPGQVKDISYFQEALDGLFEAITEIVAAEGTPDFYGEPNRLLDLPDDIDARPDLYSSAPLVTGRLWVNAGATGFVHMCAETLVFDSTDVEQIISVSIDIPTRERFEESPSSADAYDNRGHEVGTSGKWVLPFDDVHGHKEDPVMYFKILQELCTEFLEKTGTLSEQHI